MIISGRKLTPYCCATTTSETSARAGVSAASIATAIAAAMKRVFAPFLVGISNSPLTNLYRPGSASTFGFAGSVVFDTTIEGVSLISTSQSWRMRARKRFSVNALK